MKSTKVFCTVIVFLTAFNLKAQTNYSRIDSIARSIGPCDSLDIHSIVKLLTVQYSDPIKKVRAVYTWIADNIAYDCKAYHNPAKRVVDPQKILKQRKAVCSGYSSLFQEMCSIAGVQCLVIDGMGYNAVPDIGVADKEANGHSWNAVRIDGVWKLVDVTWASGYTDEKVTVFTKEFSGEYFFTDADRFLLSHYPDLKTWLPEKNKLSYTEFRNNTIFYRAYFSLGAKAVTPSRGLVRYKTGDVLHFGIEFPDSTVIRTVKILLEKKGKYIELKSEYKIEGNKLKISFECKEEGEYPTYILVNGRYVLGYRLESKF